MSVLRKYALAYFTGQHGEVRQKYMVISVLIYPSFYVNIHEVITYLTWTFLYIGFLKIFSLTSFSIVFGWSPISTFLFCEIYHNLELLSLVPFTSRDPFVSWKREAYIVQCPYPHEALKHKFEFTIGKGGTAWGPFSCLANCWNGRSCHGTGN